MKRINRPLLLAAALSFSLPAFAAQDEREEHYKGEPARTLEEAFKNMAAYDKKLEKLIAGELTPEAMDEVHQITYTLENALQRITSEVTGLADTLEQVHQASEHNDVAVTREKGKAYLDVAKRLVRE